MQSRIDYFTDLAADAVKSLESPQFDLFSPSEKATIVAALIGSDGANGLRKAILSTPFYRRPQA